jgi:hypothetical protein
MEKKCDLIHSRVQFFKNAEFEIVCGRHTDAIIHNNIIFLFHMHVIKIFKNNYTNVMHACVR